jgi:hypothetical protein
MFAGLHTFHDENGPVNADKHTIVLNDTEMDFLIHVGVCVLFSWIFLFKFRSEERHAASIPEINPVFDRVLQPSLSTPTPTTNTYPPVNIMGIPIGPNRGRPINVFTKPPF